MLKTDVEGVFRDSFGVSIVERTNYKEQRRAAMEAVNQKQKINILEEKLNSVESILKEILKKVSDV